MGVVSKYWGAVLYLLFFSLVVPLKAGSAEVQVPGRPGAERVDSLVPAALVSLASGHAVIVDKGRQTLSVFHQGNGGIERVFTVVCSTGMNDGSKEKTGDGRTPEGIYFATDRYTERELSSTYGAMAYNLNYPNAIDHRKGRTGYNIWIHGTDTELRPFQSNGCIVLNDQDIHRLSRYIQLNRTPIIILDHVQWVSEDVLLMARQELSRVFDLWIHAYQNGTMVDDLAVLYEEASSFNRESFDAIAARINRWKSAQVPAAFDVQSLSIIRHERHAMLSFDQAVTYRDRTWNFGHRVLFLGKGLDRWMISGDVLQDPSSPELLRKQLSVIDAMIKSYTEIEEMVESWRLAWQTSDMEGYASFYAPDFRGLGMNRARWLAYKTRLSRINKNIEITIGDLDITPGPGTATVFFKQEYRSSRHSDVGIKTLHLRKVNDRWKIYRERWREL